MRAEVACYINEKLASNMQFLFLAYWKSIFIHEYLCTSMVLPWIWKQIPIWRWNADLYCSIAFHFIHLIYMSTLIRSTIHIWNTNDDTHTHWKYDTVCITTWKVIWMDVLRIQLKFNSDRWISFRRKMMIRTVYYPSPRACISIQCTIGAKSNKGTCTCVNTNECVWNWCKM